MSTLSILLGLIGIALGAIGMLAKRRELATMGLMLCVLAIVVGFWQIEFDIWTSRQWLNEL